MLASLPLGKVLELWPLSRLIAKRSPSPLQCSADMCLLDNQGTFLAYPYTTLKTVVKTVVVSSPN